LIVPLAHAHGLPGIGFVLERSNFLRGHRAALKFKRMDRCATELRKVLRIGRAQIALRRNVQAHRFGDFRAEALRKPPAAELLVVDIRGPVRDVVRNNGEQMPNVVQEGCNNERRWRGFLPREVRACKACSVIETSSPKYTSAPRVWKILRISSTVFM
jgi:hypothetical protein